MLSCWCQSSYFTGKKMQPKVWKNEEGETRSVKLLRYFWQALVSGKTLECMKCNIMFWHSAPCFLTIRFLAYLCVCFGGHSCVHCCVVMCSWQVTYQVPKMWRPQEGTHLIALTFFRCSFNDAQCRTLPVPPAVLDSRPGALHLMAVQFCLLVFAGLWANAFNECHTGPPHLHLLAALNELDGFFHSYVRFLPGLCLYPVQWISQ